MHPPEPAKPLIDAQMRGAFLFVDMAKRYFTKTYSSPADLVQLLKSRGLKISDERKAERYIESIGYYRLSAYMYPFLEMPKNLHQYKTGASFKKIMMLYRFDKKLRMLLLNEIEKIEIAGREAVMNVTAVMSGDDFWLMNSIHFANPHTFADTTNLIEREYRKSTEDFIQHFKNEYTNPYPPAWILGELLTIGSVNMVYRNL